MQIIIVGLHVSTYGLMVDLCVHTTASTKAPRESNDITTTVYPASDDCVSCIGRLCIQHHQRYVYNCTE